MNTREVVRNNVLRMVAETPNRKQEYLAARGGLTQSQVSKVLRRQQYVSMETIDRWALALGCEPYELLLEKPLPKRPPVFAVLTSPEARRAAQETAEELVAIPIIPGSIAASVSGSVDVRERDVEECAVIVRKWCRKPKEFTCIRVRGESMCPTLCEGFIVAIHHGMRDLKALDGQIVATRLKDEGCVVKRLRLNRERMLGLLTSDGDLTFGKFPPIPVDLADLEEQIIGKIEWWWGRA